MSTDLSFITTAAGEIYDLVITALEENVREPLYPGDERRIFGEGFVSVVVALFNTMNDQARQSLLRFARGTVLDAMGERLECPRLEADASKTKLRYAVNQPLSRNVIIPAGSVVTGDSTIYFATTEPAVLYAGGHYVDVPAEATVGGEAGNNYKIGSINSMVDQISYINTVTNVVESSGGTDGEPFTVAGDENYRERIYKAPAKLSTAGPEAGYEYWALSADAEIRCARPVSDQKAGTVNIVVLMKDGSGPSDEVAAKVLTAANDKRIRPMNDLVTVDSPTFVEYDIELHYYTTQENAGVVLETVEGPGGAIDQYKDWQGSYIGRPINPDKLRTFILCPHWESTQELFGAVRVDIVSPSYMQLDRRSVARWSGVAKVTHSVVEE